MPGTRDDSDTSASELQSGPEGVERAATTPTVSPARSLAARISLIVFGATLLTSLVITAISVHSIDGFLRTKIEQGFPAVLASASQRLDLWYDQRLLELSVFASNGVISKNAWLVTALSNAGTRSTEAEAEIEQYLQTALDGFPEYEALFLLGTDTRPLVWTGADVELPVDALIATREKENGRGAVLECVETPHGLLQIASIRLGARSSLHGVMRIDSVGQILMGNEHSGLGEIFLLDQDGRYLIASPERMARSSWKAPVALSESDTAVIDYINAEGTRVIGSTRSLPRYGWTLVLQMPYTEAFAPVVSGIQRILGINLAIVLLFALGAFRLAGSIVRPIEALSAAARRISEGEKGVAIPAPRSRDEVGVLARTLYGMTHRLESNTRELEESHAETEQVVQAMREQNEELQRVNEILEQLSITDGLTKLHNHRYFQEHLAKEVKRAGRTGEPLALVMIDIDHFKMWNDRLGHSGGDDILRRIAEIMQQLTRETDLLARYGGEEFALLLPNTELDGAMRLAEKIRGSVAEARFFIDLPSERQPVTVSVGVSVFKGDKRSFFDQADQALYRAKASGRDCVVVADSQG